MTGYLRAALLSAAVVFFGAFGQAQTSTVPAGSGLDHASAYYNFAMGHLYAEMAGSYGNRGEYVNKAIEFYRQAIKTDPKATYIEEELTDFYVQTGQLEKALQEAQGMLKLDANNANAHKILARIYSRQIGDPDQGKVDQTMLRNALEQYRQVTELDSKDKESFSMLARLSRVSRDNVTAESAYKHVLEQDPDDEDALNGLAMVFADRGDMTAASDMLKKAVEKNPEPRNVVMLAQFYDQAKDYARGADAWQQAVKLTNGNVKVLRAYAADCYAAGRFDEALKALQELAIADPKDDKLHLQIAELLRNKHDYEGASAALAKAKAINSTPIVRFAEAELLNAQGKPAEAIASVQALLNDTKKDKYTDEERGNRVEMLDRMANYQLKSGKATDAINTYHQIGDMDPALAARAAVQAVEGLKGAREYKLARQEADAALKRYPNERSVVFVHALLLGDLGQPEQAIAELKALPNSARDRDVLLMMVPIQEKARRFDDEKKTLDAAEGLSKSAQEKQSVEFMRGAMYERQKNFDAAEKSFRAVLEADANNAGAMNYLGYMFADRGIRLDEARQLITKALDIDPDNPAYLDSMAWVHYHQDQLEQAVGAMQKALDKISDDPTMHDHMGDIYLKQGKTKEAIQQFETALAGWKIAAPGDLDPAEVARVTKKLDGAKAKGR